MAAKTAIKALILGDDTRSFLACIRSLGRLGNEVHAGCELMDGAALRSRYLARVHRLPDVAADTSAWLDAVIDVVVKEDINYILPCDERSLLPIAANRGRFPRGVVLAIPDQLAVDVLFDKRLTRELAEQAGVPIPPGRPIGRAALADELSAGQLAFPLVIKPFSSYTLDHLHQRGRVKVCLNDTDARETLETSTHDGFLVEEFVPGIGGGLSIVAESGRVLAAFQHVRQHPMTSGSSAYRKSVPVDDGMLAECQRMAIASRFTGIAMFEFRVCPESRRHWLIEVNARPWGSLPLAVALGIDFPAIQQGVLLGCAAPATAPGRYRTGIYGRNLRQDLGFLSEQLHRRRGDGITSRLVFVARYAAGFARMLAGREKSDTLVADDPMPGFAEAWQLAMQYARARRLSFAFRASTNFKGLERLFARRGRSRAASVLFVCHGNICRSPFAAAWLRSLLQRSGNNSLAVESAGVYPHSGRPTPAMGTLVASEEFAIDLQGHSSCTVTPAMLEAHDVIVVFDVRNYEELLSRFPGVAPRLAFITAPVNQRGSKVIEIEDPYGGDRAQFEACYRQIASAVVALAALL